MELSCQGIIINLVKIYFIIYCESSCQCISKQMNVYIVTVILYLRQVLSDVRLRGL